MSKPKVEFRPLADEGMDFRKPAYARKYNLLQNTLPYQGNLTKRPGMRTYGPYQHEATYIPGPCVGLIEVDTNTEAFAVARLIPDGTIDNVTWTITGAATVHEAIDDSPPDDDTTKVDTDTANDYFSVTFANPATSPEAVYGITIGGRIRNKALSGIITPVEVYLSTDGAAWSLMGTIYVNTFQWDETNAWQDWQIFSMAHPVTEVPYTLSELQALRIRIKKLAAPEDTHESMYPDADGFYTAWDSSGTAYQLIDNKLDDRTCLRNWYKGFEDQSVMIDGSSAAIGSKQSVSFGSVSATYTAVEYVSIFFTVRGINGGYSVVQPFKRTGGVDYNVGNPITVYTKGYDNAVNIWYHLTEDPATGVAWVDANLSNQEWGLQILERNDGSPYWSKATLGVRGTVETGVELTQLYVDWAGQESGGERIRDQLVVGQNSIERVASQGNSTLTDITNSITWTSLPMLKTDFAFQNGILYMVNGMNQIAWYPNSNLMAQFSAKPYGTCMTDFGGRLMLGDATESGTRNKDRLRWSDIEDLTDWSAALAGDLDVHDTPGAWLKLEKLLGSVVGYKENGIYEIVITPEVTQPFRHYLRDPATSCVAGASVWPATLPDGRQVHLFLGRGSSGLNVYQYDGAQAVPIGNEIADELRDTVDERMERWSFGIVCPWLKCYLLFIPKLGRGFGCNEAWVWHLPTATWHKWTFSMDITCAGIYTVPTVDLNANSQANPLGTKKAVFGGASGFPFTFDSTYTQDETTAGKWRSAASSTQNEPSTGGDNVGYQVDIPWMIETGELYHPDLKKVGAARLHVYYRDRGPCWFAIYTSQDGGYSWTEHTLVEGGLTDRGRILKAEVGIDDIQTERLRIRIGAPSSKTKYPLPEYASWANKIEIEDIVLEIDQGGTGI